MMNYSSAMGAEIEQQRGELLRLYEENETLRQQLAQEQDRATNMRATYHELRQEAEMLLKERDTAEAQLAQREADSAMLRQQLQLVRSSVVETGGSEGDEPWMTLTFPHSWLVHINAALSGQAGAALLVRVKRREEALEQLAEGRWRATGLSAFCVYCDARRGDHADWCPTVIARTALQGDGDAER